METPFTHAPPNSRAAQPPALKIIGAVIAGLLTWILIATILNLPLRLWWPHYHEAEATFNFTFAMKLARLTLGAASSICSGSIAAWLVRRGSAAVTITGIILLALFIPNHYALWNKFPVWYHLTFLFSLLPLTLLGGKLNSRWRNMG